MLGELKLSILGETERSEGSVDDSVGDGVVLGRSRVFVLIVSGSSSDGVVVTLLEGACVVDEHLVEEVVLVSGETKRVVLALFLSGLHLGNDVEENLLCHVWGCALVLAYHRDGVLVPVACNV